MILIADSGSTKTAWMEVETGNMVVTEGLNPHFTTDEQFLDACATVRQHFPQLQTTDSLTTYFYGAGCGDDRQRQRVEQLLAATLRPSELHVETDMLGACRAVSGDKASLVGILGTGSNVCYYDGQNIACQPTSTGFIMGDNGSANHVGRILLNDYLTQRMPDALRSMFHDTYPMTDAQLIDAVYHQPNANRFLASLAPFAVHHEEENYCSEVIRTALHDFYYGPLQTVMERSHCPEAELNLVGGFAKAIEPFLRRYFTTAGLSVGTVLADPIDGLRDYHRFPLD